MREVEVGDIVILDDKQTIKDQIKTGGSVAGKRAKVIKIEKITTDVCSWTLYALDYDNLYLVVQQVDDIQELCLYSRVDEFPMGDRSDVLHVAPWIFENPEEGVDNLDNLCYTTCISAPDGSDFHQKMDGTLWGEDQDGLLAGVIEWRTDADIENPDLMLTEVGDGDHGGLIILYQGCEIAENDIEVMKG